MSKLRAVVGISVMVWASTAHAGETYRTGDTSGASTDWSGLYLGVHGGWTGARIDGRDAGIFGEGIPSVDTSTGALGFQIGVQRQFGNAVLGIEGGLTAPVGNRNSKEDYPTEPGNVLEAGVDEIWFVGPRVGYAFGNLMPYMTGGYASTSMSATLIQSGNPLLSYEERRMDGWYLGGGVDWSVGRNWTLGLDYRHYDFGDTVIVPIFNGGPDPFDAIRYDVKADAVTLRLNYKFGDDPKAGLFK